MWKPHAENWAKVGAAYILTDERLHDAAMSFLGELSESALCGLSRRRVDHPRRLDADNEKAPGRALDNPSGAGNVYGNHNRNVATVAHKSAGLLRHFASGIGYAGNNVRRRPCLTTLK
ncbi:hypothetical protein Ari01nite_23500 [Paractinoplanes rishiriensis]|uniref:Uncharacterized protein n=1 Tax=Paractinoplanes rishiriensis TaxID=1050105 RepID=A0A919JWJ6_9ACTN|nr:hypothetical protein Ari01nite_23500 [Actinoplanes rishiriensis]